MKRLDVITALNCYKDSDYIKICMSNNSFIMLPYNGIVIDKYCIFIYDLVSVSFIDYEDIKFIIANGYIGRHKKYDLNLRHKMYYFGG